MSEMLHQPEELGIQPEVKIPETVEIHKIPDMEAVNEKAVKYFEKEGYVSNKRLSEIMRMASAEIGKMLSNGRKLSYEKAQEAEDKFLGRIDNPDEELLAKIFFGIVLTNIRAAELEDRANYEERNKFFKENIQQKHWIEYFIYKNQENPEVIEEFWKEYEPFYNKLPILQKERKYKDDRNKNNKYYSKKDNFKIDKSGILGEVAAMNLFDEIKEEEEMEIKFEQASTEEDMKGIDLIIILKDKFGNLKTVPVQIKCRKRDYFTEEIVKFYTRPELKNSNDKDDGKEIQNFKKNCLRYEQEKSIKKRKGMIAGGFFIDFISKIKKNKDKEIIIVNDEGKITNDRFKENIKKQLKKHLLELN
jgi:hypothetical protein